MRKDLIDWFFPLVMGTLVLCGTTLAPAICNPTTRWLMVLAVVAIGVTSVSARSVWHSYIFKLIAAYLLLCLASVAWSQMSTLSLYKALAAWLVTVGMFSVGYAWMQRRSSLPDFWILFYWVVPASVTVAALGKGERNLAGIGGDYYGGLSGNSNYLGWMMAISFAPLFWKVFDRQTSIRNRRICFLLLLSIVYFLLLSQSRGAVLIVLCSCVGWLIASDTNRKLLIVSITALLLIITLLVTPGVGDHFYQKYVLKGNTTNLEDAYQQSRGEPFALTLAAAKKVWVFGAGYGVSVGADSTSYRGGLSAVGYGREKGSSALAIIEEVGVAGLVLVLLIVVHVFRRALKAYRKARTQKVRSIMGLLTGLLFGMVLHANIEAWFVAPGSAESILFWGVLGAFYALSSRVINRARAKKLKPRPFSSPSAPVEERA